MADQNHSLFGHRVTVVLNDRFEKFDDGVGGVGSPVAGLKLGGAASWKVDGQTRSDGCEARQQGVELRDRATQPVDKDQQRDRGGRGGKVVGVLMSPIEDAKLGVCGLGGRVRLYAGAPLDKRRI